MEGAEHVRQFVTTTILVSSSSNLNRKGDTFQRFITTAYTETGTHKSSSYIAQIYYILTQDCCD